MPPNRPQPEIRDTNQEDAAAVAVVEAETNRGSGDSSTDFEILFAVLLRHRAADAPMTDDEIMQARQHGRP